jgi:hypothetical protein
MSTPDLSPAGIAARKKARLRATRPVGMPAKVIGMVVAALFVGMMLTAVVTVAIWPGEAKLFGPILCSDARPDAVVVYDTHSVRPGETSVTFTLYCVGERGDAESHGFGTIFFLASALHTLVVLALWGGLWARSRARRRRR